MIEYRQAVTLQRHAHLRDHRHRQRPAARLIGFGACFIGAVESRQPGQAHQVDRHGGTAVTPVAVIQIGVGVVTDIGKQVQARKQRGNLLARLVLPNTRTVILFAQFGAPLERHHLEFVDIHRHRRELRVGHISKGEIGARGHVHQGREFALGKLHFLTFDIHHRHRIEQGALISQRLRRRQHPGTLGGARTFEPGAYAHHQRFGLARQRLRAGGAPISIAHILHNVLQNLATTLLGDQIFVGCLFGAVITDTEIERVP